MLHLDTSPTLRGTPTALLRLMTPSELQTRLDELERAYPKTYRPTSHLERRFYSTARNEMTRIRRELRRASAHNSDVSSPPAGCVVTTPPVAAHPILSGIETPDGTSDALDNRGGKA